MAIRIKTVYVVRFGNTGTGRPLSYVQVQIIY